MITAELKRKINLLSQDSYDKVEAFVEQLLELNAQSKRDVAFKTFMNKMNVAEKSVLEKLEEKKDEVKATIGAKKTSYRDAVSL